MNKAYGLINHLLLAAQEKLLLKKADSFFQSLTMTTIDNSTQK
jgi:hypothetical protein